MRPLHANVGAAALAHDACSIASLLENRRDRSANRIAEAHVGHNAVAEKRGNPCIGAIDELVRNNEVSRLVFFFERADGRDRQDTFDPQHLHRKDIRAEVQLAGQKTVPASVPREKSNVASLKFTENEGIGGIAKRCRYALFAHIRKSGHGVQTTAPDNPNLCLLQTLCSLLADRGRTKR